ncbi:hypothetical protein GCM10020254_82880 [Streptomyces goshikiensis]
MVLRPASADSPPGKHGSCHSLAAAEQKLTALRDLAAWHPTVHLGTSYLRSVIARVESEQPNGGAKQQYHGLERGDDRLPLFQVRHRDHAAVG